MGQCDPRNLVRLGITKFVWTDLFQVGVGICEGIHIGTELVVIGVERNVFGVAGGRGIKLGLIGLVLIGVIIIAVCIGGHGVVWGLFSMFWGSRLGVVDGLGLVGGCGTRLAVVVGMVELALAIILVVGIVVVVGGDNIVCVSIALVIIETVGIAMLRLELFKLKSLGLKVLKIDEVWKQKGGTTRVIAVVGMGR